MLIINYFIINNIFKIIYKYKIFAIINDLFLMTIKFKEFIVKWLLQTVKKFIFNIYIYILEERDSGLPFIFPLLPLF